MGLFTDSGQSAGTWGAQPTGMWGTPVSNGYSPFSGAKPWGASTGTDPGGANQTGDGLFGATPAMYGGPPPGMDPQTASMFAQPARGDGQGILPGGSNADGSMGSGQSIQQTSQDSQNQTSLFGIGDGKNPNSTNTTFTPWGPQAEALKKMYGNAQGIYDANIKQGYIGLDPASQQALQQMQNMATAPNALVAGATGAVRGVESGSNAITTGNAFGNIANNPGIDTNHFDALYRNPQVDTNHFDALYNNPGINNAPQYQALFDHPGVNNAAQYQSLFDNQPTANYFGESYQKAKDPGSLDQGLYGQVASGSMVGNNPAANAVLQDALDQAQNRIKASVSGAGRYGSSMMGSEMSRGLGSVAANFNQQQYENDMSRAMQGAQAQDQAKLARLGLGQSAAQGIANVQEQNHANKLAAAQGLSGIEGQNAAMKMNAAQGLSNVEGQNAQMKLNAAQARASAQGANAQQLMQAAQGVAGVQGQNVQNQLSALQGQTGVQGQNIQNQLQAAGMAPAMQNLRYDDLQRLAQVGAARQQNAQAQQQFGWDQLNQQHGIVGGVPGAAGSGSSTPPSTPWWQSLLGAGSTILGGLGSLFG